MEMDWVTIPDFPDYLISNQGDVLNKHSGRPIRPSRTKDGSLKVGLVLSGKQFTRSVKVLVAENFVPGKDEISDTPIHLDGDADRNSADNIVWRPRWFAWEYKHQFHNVTDNDHIGPLKDQRGVFYYDIYQAAIYNGLLFRDIRKSLATGDSVFPTFQVFRMA